MVIISLKLRNLGLKIFIESGFSVGNHCLNDYAASQKIELNCDGKHLAIAFDYRALVLT